MHRVIAGIHRYLNDIAPRRQAMFGELAKGQHPPLLLITCSDSRIAPELFIQSDPGLLFVIRNAGNIVPPYADGPCGESATIEYAVRQLKITHIAVCGHTGCGAMQGVLNRPAVRDLPLVDGWLHHAEASLAAAQARQPGATVDVDDLARANVMVQADRLLGYPFIAEAVDAGELFIHRWLFQIADGQLWRHDQRQGEFVRFEDSGGPIDEASA